MEVESFKDDEIAKMIMSGLLASRWSFVTITYYKYYMHLMLYLWFVIQFRI